jgi:carbonic anhydrase
MKKVFHFGAPREQYVCDAAVVWCFDNRFEVGFAKFLKRLGIINVDPIKIAGGAKSLASPAKDSDREFVIAQIEASIRLHATRLVILMVHSDCGAYGGLAAFNNDGNREAKHHEEELRRAVRCVNERVPELAVDAYFVDFEGVWKPDLARTEMSVAAGSHNS